MKQGRPKGGKNRKYSYEEKLRIVKLYIDDCLSSHTIEKNENVSSANVRRWVKVYLEKGIEGLKEMNGSKRENHFAALHSSKSMTNEQRLRLENMKLKIENESLKKGYLMEGDGIEKEYVSIYEKNMKSSKNEVKSFL